jgi:hypothetical protein
MEGWRRGARAPADAPNHVPRTRSPRCAARDHALTGDTIKLKIRIDDDETRAPWETAKKAKAEVESWPAWKHNELRRASSDTATSDASTETSRDQG